MKTLSTIVLSFAFLAGATSTAQAARHDAVCTLDTMSEEVPGEPLKVNLKFTFSDEDIRLVPSQRAEAAEYLSDGVRAFTAKDVVVGNVEGKLKYEKNGVLLYEGPVHTAVDRMGIILLNGKLAYINLAVYLDYPSARAELRQGFKPYPEDGQISIQTSSYNDWTGPLHMEVPGINLDYNRVFENGLDVFALSKKTKCQFRSK